MSAPDLKAVAKGFAMLEILNAHNGASAVQLARHLRIPRSTAFRLLSSAMDAGFVDKDSARRYRLTRAARLLSPVPKPSAFTPVLLRLHEMLGWPISIVSLHGEVALRDETSDRWCPQIDTRDVPGGVVPLATNAAGLAIAAQLPRKSPLLVHFAPAARRLCADARKNGYSKTVSRRELEIALPLRLSVGPGALAVRLPRVAIETEMELKRVLKILAAAARRIERLAAANE